MAFFRFAPGYLRILLNAIAAAAAAIIITTYSSTGVRSAVSTAVVRPEEVASDGALVVFR